MDHSMNRRILKARRTGKITSNEITKTKHICDAITIPSQSSFQHGTRSPEESNFGSSSSPYSPKFSANDRLRKYRTSLEHRKNEVVKVHQVLSTPTFKKDKCKNASLPKSRSFLALAAKKEQSKNITSNKKSILLGKRKENNEIETSSVNEINTKRMKINNNRDNIPVRNDRIKYVTENIKEKIQNVEKSNILHNGVADKSWGSEEDAGMDWSPIDQNEVVSNIQRFRDKHKENSLEMHTTTSLNTVANTSSTSNADERTYVVVDTNIFISHLNIVRDMLSKEHDAAGYIVYVPWIVMQELDYFKDGRSGSSAMLKSAMKAVKFINENLVRHRTRLKGQTVKEALYEKHSSSNPDDNILFCCIRLAQTTNTVILLSNDINLRNKALINDIAAYGPKDILTKVRGLNTNNDNKEKLHQINSLLSGMCTEIILTEMKEAYGSVLYKLIKEPPWDLKQCLTYIKRFWSPVFSLLISQKQCLKVIEDLLTLIQSTNDITTEGNMENFIKLCLSMCVYFKNCLNKYKGTVESNITNMQKILS